MTLLLAAKLTLSYWVTFSSTTAVGVYGSQHGLESPSLTVQCLDTSVTPYQGLEPDHFTVDPVTFDVQIFFATPQTGKCVIRD